MAGRKAGQSGAALAVLGPRVEVGTLDVSDDEALRFLMIRVVPNGLLAFTAGGFRSAPIREQTLEDASHGMDIKF